MADDSSGGSAGELRTAKADNWWQRGLRSGTGQAVRWLLVLALLLAHWLVTALGPVTGHAHWLTTGSLVFGQKGSPASFGGWVPVIIVSLLLLLPDADSIAFGGVKLEMRRTREEVTGLRDQVTNLQVAQASATGIGALNLTFQMAKETAAAAAVPLETKANEDAGMEPYEAP